MLQFKKTSLEEFKKIIQPILSAQTFPQNLSDQIKSDLSNVVFTVENVEFNDGLESNINYTNYPCGFEVLTNEMPVLFLCAGRYEDVQVCFILYWDGKQVRGYVPREGNAYDKDSNEAYITEACPLAHGDPTKIKADITSNFIEIVQ